MMRAVVLCAMVLGVAGCQDPEDAIRFDGQIYRTDIDSERKNRTKFEVSARPVSASLLGAREAARYEATIYCVNEYGSSGIDWIVGPDSPDADLQIQKDTLVLSGSCRE